jgi:hypothetical protein
MILDFYDIDDDDQAFIESGAILVLLFGLLGAFYHIIVDKSGPEL